MSDFDRYDEMYSKLTAEGKKDIEKLLLMKDLENVYGFKKERIFNDVCEIYDKQSFPQEFSLRDIFKNVTYSLERGISFSFIEHNKDKFLEEKSNFKDYIDSITSEENYEKAISISEEEKDLYKSKIYALLNQNSFTKNQLEQIEETGRFGTIVSSSDLKIGKTYSQIFIDKDNITKIPFVYAGKNKNNDCVFVIPSLSIPNEPNKLTAFSMDSKDIDEGLSNITNIVGKEQEDSIWKSLYLDGIGDEDDLQRFAGTLNIQEEEEEL